MPLATAAPIASTSSGASTGRSATRRVCCALGTTSEAIAQDPDFAEAHAGFADATNAYVILFGVGSGRTAAAPAITAARQAIALDSTLAPAHAALGFALMFFHWNWAEADFALARAIDLDPEYGPARYWYTQLLWVRGRPAEALEQARQAIAVDPLSAVAHLAYARSFRLLGRTEEWVAALTRAIELQPTLWVPYVDLAEYHAGNGRPDRAADEVRRFLAAADPNHTVDDAAVRALVRIMGGEGDAADVVRRLQRAGISLQPGTAARWFALTGQSDSAFARMDQAVEAQSADVATTLPFLQPLLGEDPRWSVLQRRVGLVPDAASSRAGVVREPTWAMRQTPIRLQTFILRAPREAYVLTHR